MWLCGRRPARKSKTNLPSSLTGDCRSSFAVGHRFILGSHTHKYYYNFKTTRRGVVTLFASRSAFLIKSCTRAYKMHVARCCNNNNPSGGGLVICAVYSRFFPRTIGRGIHPRRKRETSVCTFTSVVYKRRFFFYLFLQRRRAANPRSTDTTRRSTRAQKSTILLLNFPDGW